MSYRGADAYSHTNSHAMHGQVDTYAEAAADARAAAVMIAK
jgi:hypothetical protein